MVENRKKHRQNSHPIIHCPTSKGVSEVSERVSGANEGANGQASGPVLQSVFLAVIDHSGKSVFIPQSHTDSCIDVVVGYFVLKVEAKETYQAK